MKPFLFSRTLVQVAALAVITFSAVRLAAADDPSKAKEALQGAIQSDRLAIVAGSLRLTEAEAPAFWPLYRKYRASQEKVGDDLYQLVREYADAYPNVPEDRARRMLDQYLALEKKLASQRAQYLPRFAKILSAERTLRFAQVENRLDLALREQLANTIPLVPIEGPLTGTGTDVSVMAKGVPGGVFVQTYELTATVAAIDQATRRVTLVGPDGIKQTVEVGPGAINFDQVHLGDRLVVTVAEEIVVAVAGEGESLSGGGAQWVGIAPKGAKPAGVLAQTTQVTAKVVAIDTAQRKATLQFADGSTRTVAVRADVDLSKRKVGDQVAIRVTQALAVQVKKP
jgi:Spy/CpxP family protein refolding chaperone